MWETVVVNVLDLFSGIGGFSLGLERAGMRTVAFCEIDPFCRRVLTKHWPDVPIYSDIRKLTGEQLRTDGIAVDVICGGFPCQPFSSAARGRNHRDSNLWPEMCRIISECRSAWIICENVADFDRLAIREMVADLERLGYEISPPFEIPACAVGHDHRRPRLWICGHTNSQSQSKCAIDEEVAWLFRNRPVAGNDRATDGISRRMDRLRSLGNAVVPQIPEIIGRAIMKAANAG
jgi:DNA (cytosine-5)-methyltransferase 1